MGRAGAGHRSRGGAAPDPPRQGRARSLLRRCRQEHDALLAQLLLRRVRAGGQRLDRQAARGSVAAGRERQAARDSPPPRSSCRRRSRELLRCRCCSRRCGACGAPPRRSRPRWPWRYLPVEVLTSRSDTMDGVMMALIVLALLLIVRAMRERLERLAAGGRGGAGDRLRREAARVARRAPGPSGARLPRAVRVTAPAPAALSAAGAVYVVVALSWLTATLLAPAHDRPYAIGSTNGSAWNAAFVFNGTDRLSGKSPEPQSTVYESGRHYPQATQSERDHIPIVPPSPTRLLARIGPLSGERLGLELLAALLLGVPALLWAAASRRRRARRTPRRQATERPRLRIVRACAAPWHGDWPCGC